MCPAWTLATRPASMRPAWDTRHEAPGPAMLLVCRRSLGNVLGQDGTARDAAGYRLLSIPGGYEVRARFC